ncbi:hypothetical protein VTL71DRAFT_10570 [Oculimacula yallundae]|uniref:FHA domain-containing protein n=1 Tax=Oculimacula yallundae TaxID=86028 RepID=A0ABR4CVP7_9HELO
MENQANVTLTLTALNGDLSIAERVLTLNSKENAIPVGRASKSVTKGILGAANNAWFDSPVMSRNHATIEYNSEDMAVTIKDIGSMHGTYLNGIALASDTPAVLTSNDVVVFGAEVRRGTEVFPACSFQVTYKSTPHKSQATSANTYTFPESSDIEEDGEDSYDGYNEDDMDMGDRENLCSSEDDVSIEPTPMKLSQVSDAIDLTGDDFPRDMMSNHIDLTGPTTAKILEIISGPAGVDEDADLDSNAISAANHPIVLDSEDEGDNEDVDFSSDSEDQSEDNASKDSDRARIYAVFEDDSEVGDSQIEGSVDDSDMDDDVEMEQEQLGSPNPTTVNNLTRYAVATDENSVTRHSDIRTRLELPDSDEEDAESDFSLDEAGAAGMKALWGGPSSSFPAPVPEWEDEIEIGTHFENDDIPMIYKSALGLVSTRSFPSKPVVAPSAEGQQDLLRSFPVVRQPSPSDAAMVKTANQPRKVSICDLGESSEYSPQALGEKSGKPAFFAAREVNKAKFGLNEQHSAMNSLQAANRTAHAFLAPSNPEKTAGTSDVATAISDAAAGKLTRGWTDSANSSFDALAPESSKPLAVSSGIATSSIPTRDYCQFLDKPDQSPIEERAPSPLPDMTSSYSYNTSKDAMKSASAAQRNPRSAIKITDLVESSSPFNQTKSLKRKVDSISNVTDKELRNWANSNVSSDVPKAPAAAAIEKLTGMTSVTEMPAAKRFKKLLANAGYVALGGATLFAALVATAPDLM